MTMRPMSLSESRESSGEVSLGTLFDGAEDIHGSSSWDVEDMVQLICRGGWPEAVASGEGVVGELARDYVDAVAERDVSLPDGVKRDRSLVEIIMAAYARCAATQANGTTIRSNVHLAREDVSRNTVSAYISSLRKLYLFEDLPSWRPSLRDKARITATPKRHFVDPSLAAAALGATPQSLLRDLPTAGQLFESLVVRDLRVYAQAIGGTVHHYHDTSGREADAVIVMPDGRWALIEVKLGGKGVEDGARDLVKLADRIDQALMGPPSFLAVIHAGRYAARLSNGVFAIPLGCLGR